MIGYLPWQTGRKALSCRVCQRNHARWRLMSRAPWNNVLHPAAGTAGRPLATASAAAALRRLQYVHSAGRKIEMRDLIAPPLSTGYATNGVGAAIVHVDVHTKITSAASLRRRRSCSTPVRAKGHFCRTLTKHTMVRFKTMVVLCLSEQKVYTSKCISILSSSSQYRWLAAISSGVT